MPVPNRSGLRAERRTLRDVAYHAIKNGIIDGTFRPGERLDDRELQDWLGVSRTPIREAIVMLGTQGLVDTKAQRHTRVASPDPAKAIEEVRATGALMAGVIRQTVPALNDLSAQALTNRIGEIRAATGRADLEAAMAAMNRFHELVLLHCPNHTLARIVTEAVTTLSYYVKHSLAPDNFSWVELELSCERLKAAIDRRDPIEAELVVASMHLVPDGLLSYAA